MVMAASALFGGVAVTGQLLGVLRWTGAVAWAPTALLLAGVYIPLIAAVRVAMRWLGGGP
jgi:hypothetical protein